MKKQYSLFLAGFLFALLLSAQDQKLSDLKYGSIIESYLIQNTAKYKLQSIDLKDLVVSSTSTTNKSGLDLAYVNQTYQGVKILNAISTFAIKENEVFYCADNFEVNPTSRINTRVSSITAKEAVRNFVYGIEMCCSTGELVLVKQEGNKYVFQDESISNEDIIAELVYVKSPKTNDLILAWDVEISTVDHQHLYKGRVNAQSSKLIDYKDAVLRCSFAPQDATNNEHEHTFEAAREEDNSFTLFKVPEAFAPVAEKSKYKVLKIPVESPNHGSQTIVESPADPKASPKGWHSTGSKNYTITRGNNINAYEDTGNANSPGKQPDGGSNLVFDYDWDKTKDPKDQQNAAITNLFYMANTTHDVYYQYGFDEESGNFQENNFGKGGSGGDAINCEAQDGSGMNNANFVGRADGSPGRVQMYLFDMNGGTRRDGDMDNNIISHEYGHGISLRLAGGRNTMGCLSGDEQMGEGWSDFFGTVLTMPEGAKPEDKRGSGTYALKQPTDGKGIRNYPYSTDMNINPFTYKDIADRKQSVPHGVGSVWCTMLWDLTWAYIKKYGYDTDFYNGKGGNNRVMQIVIDGLKLQKCNAGFVDGRDAILKADMALTGGKDQCMIWEVFAKRGLGYKAEQGSSKSRSDQKEDFSMPPADDPTLENCTTTSVDEVRPADYSVYPNPSNNELFISVKKEVKNAKLTLADINGRVIISKILTLSISEDTRLDVSHLASGAYILNIKGKSINTFDKILKK